MVSAHKPQHCHITEGHSRLSNRTSKTTHRAGSQSRSMCLLVSPSSPVRTGCWEGTEQF